ncbi:MAG: DUF368 domain-containing protein [Eubacteriales bacterium]|nr:DUF368 domain-containing protein [Eubacteriales bacterium]
MNKGFVGVIKRFVAGIVIGIGGIIPGVSGGILAVSMGIYKPMLDAIGCFFKNIKKNFLFLIPIAIGGVVGVLSMSKLVEITLEKYEMFVMYLFIGLVAGGIPGILKTANSRTGFKPKYLIASICGALFIGALALCERLLINGKSLPFNVWTAILGGGLISVGTVIPGVSTSFILIFLGLYKPMLSCFNTFVDFKLIFTMLSGDAAARDAWLNSFLMLLFVALGLAVVALALILFVRRLFNKHHEYAHYAVLGFLITSAILIFPGFERSFMQLIYTALLAGGFFIAYFIDRFIANGE